MKELLLLSYLLLVLTGTFAHAGEIGSMEGGHCETCSVWIEEVKSDGGIIYTAISSGILEGNYSKEIEALAEGNCKLKGMGVPLYSKDWLVHMGFWTQTRARLFGCGKPNVFVESEGVISSLRINDFEVKQAAEAYCNSHNIKFAVITPPLPTTVGQFDKFRQETRFNYT